MSRSNGRRYGGIGIIAACILLGASTAAVAQIGVGVGVAVPGFRLGINIPAYPDLVAIPGYPVYYAPRLGVNLFFYDGLYWIFVGDQWYYSTWYDGPWYLAEPQFVPDFILRIPILYYRRPPPYFLRWNRLGPPRWGEHWGRAWQQRRRGWDRWNRARVPLRAPLPSYQRHYPRDRYPRLDRQRALENRFYRFRPRYPRGRPPAQRNRPPSERGPQWERSREPPAQRFAPERRQPQTRPEVRRAPPGAMQRPGLRRPAPPARTEGRRPEANRRPGVRGAPARNARPPSQRHEKKKDQGRQHDGQGQGRDRRGQPPG